MFKTVAAAALSGILALGALTAAGPAHADNNDFGRIVGGIAALAILGAAIDAANDNNNHPSRGLTVINPGHAPVRGHTNVVRLPSQCRHVFHTQHGPRAFFARHCTRTHFARPHLLPGNCLRQIRLSHGPRAFYAGPCMRRAGFHF